ncbi:MAG: histidine ammonia-lyase [Dehalobacterium sp.]
MLKDTQLKNVVIDGYKLTLDQVVTVARGFSTDNGEKFYPVVLLCESAEKNLYAVRNYVEENWLAEDAPPVYGFNTGVGPLKNTKISADDNKLFQKRLIESHAAAIGEPAPEEVVRATMLMRANALARGVSGVRPQVIHRILEMLNKGVLPVIPQQGSVGASGDLGPLAHLVASLVGHKDAEAFYKGERIPASEALRAADINPVEFDMEAKEALAMINGCTFSLGFGALVMEDAWQVFHNVNLACALSMEAMRGEMAAFDHRIQEARNHPGQIEVAAKIREYLEHSQWVTDAARRIKLPTEKREGEWKSRVQDAYTLRCVPQVHGAVLDVLKWAQQIIEREMNAATDNPLIFPTNNGTGYEALSGGNFHGENLAFATDFIAIAIHELGDLSERRSSRFLDANLNYGIPQNLIGSTKGLNTGFTVAQCTASALVMENRTLCTPASADSIPNKSNQEDHVSMATWSARKARMVIENTVKIVGVEFLCACQAISLVERSLEGKNLAPTTQMAYQAFRNKIPATIEDRFMHKQLEEAIELTRSGYILHSIHSNHNG